MDTDIADELTMALETLTKRVAELERRVALLGQDSDWDELADLELEEEAY